MTSYPCCACGSWSFIHVPCGVVRQAELGLGGNVKSDKMLARTKHLIKKFTGKLMEATLLAGGQVAS